MCMFAIVLYTFYILFQAIHLTPKGVGFPPFIVIFDNQFGVGLLIGEKEKLFDALVKTIQDNLFKNKSYFSNTDEENQEFNRQSRNSAVEFVFRQWPELKPY